jgi:hypothetical protein
VSTGAAQLTSSPWPSAVPATTLPAFAMNLRRVIMHAPSAICGVYCPGCFRIRAKHSVSPQSRGDEYWSALSKLGRVSRPCSGPENQMATASGHGSKPCHFSGGRSSQKLTAIWSSAGACAFERGGGRRASCAGLSRHPSDQLAIRVRALRAWVGEARARRHSPAATTTMTNLWRPIERVYKMVLLQYLALPIG